MASIREQLSDEVLQSLFGPEIARAEKAQARMTELRAAIADAERERSEIEPLQKPLLAKIYDAQDEVARIQAHIVGLQRDAQILKDRHQHLGARARQWQSELAELEHPAPKGEVLRSAYRGGGPAF
jgi:chromosome segregation ATPase